MVPQYRYQPVTHKDIMNCVRWCQNHFQLRDWQIEVETGDLPSFGEAEDAYGLCATEKNFLSAAIWVGIDRCKKIDNSALVVCIHEVLHVFADAAGLEGDSEPLCYRLSPLLFQLYCSETKKKQAELR